MKLNLSDPIEKAKAQTHFKKLLKKEAKIELKELGNSRTARQNRALHLFFQFISDELNNIGQDFEYTGISGKTFSVPHTPELVKEFIWRPIQIALFNIKSTTKLDTNKMDRCADVIIKFFGDMGIELVFPSFERLMEEDI